MKKKTETKEEGHYEIGHSRFGSGYTGSPIFKRRNFIQL